MRADYGSVATPLTVQLKSPGWIGFDLDGTLAIDTPNRINDLEIGAPVKLMVDRVKAHINKGDDVRLFTARAYNASSEVLEAIRAWMIIHLGVELPIQAYKDHDLRLFYDDKAVTVLKNTGIVSLWEVP